MSDLLTQHRSVFILGTECRHPFHKGHPKPDQVPSLHTICLKCQADHAAPVARELQAARLARSRQPTAGCNLGVCWDNYIAGGSAETGNWPWFASPCGQMKLLVRASTWHFAFVTFLPFQRADRAPFKIQTACWWALRMRENLHFQWKMKMPESPFYQVLNKNKFIFFMPIIICLEGAGAALRTRREDAWASSADGEGLWLDRAEGRASRNWCSLAKHVLLVPFQSSSSQHNRCLCFGKDQKDGAGKKQRFWLTWGTFWKRYYIPFN